MLLTAISIITIIKVDKKEIKLDNVSLKEETQNLNGLAIMLEQDDGNYKESSSNSWPADMYFNEELSGCVDNLGNKIENTLTYENGIANVETSDTSYCVLYFDKTTNLYQLCKNYNDINSCLISNETKLKDINNLSKEIQGELYRYQGTKDAVNNNYICFGTSNLDECISDTDKYMYRIIGITNQGNLKLIKKEALNESYQWHNLPNIETFWPNSSVFNNINGDKFLKNTNYVPSGWENKIMDYSWKYGSTTGVEFIDVLPEKIYERESNFTNFKIAKIGLMYINDVYFGANENCWSNYSNCKNGWINISHNDLEADNYYNLSSPHEWLLTHEGYYESVGNYLAYVIGRDGKVVGWEVHSWCVIRPVFYLISTEKIINGNGKIDFPYIIN